MLATYKIFINKRRLLPWWMALSQACMVLFITTAVNANEKIPVHVEEIVGGRCFICHGLMGESTSPLFPRLAGQHADYVTKQLNDFYTGRRKTDTMKSQLDGINPNDFKSIAAYYALQKPAENEDSFPPSPKGKAIYEQGIEKKGVIACATCHGPQGHGAPTLPRLAGQQPAYIKTQLMLFNKRQRTNDNAVMQDIAKSLTEEDIVEVSNYIATLH